MKKHKHYLQDMSWTEFEDRLDEVGRTVILPVTTVEMQGPYYPFGLHLYNLKGVMKKAEALYDDIIFAPIIPVGASSEMSSAFPGNVGVKLETLIQVYNDICNDLIRHKVERIVWLIGCGGCVTASEVVSRRLRRKYGTLFVGIQTIGGVYSQADMQAWNASYLTEGHAGKMWGQMGLANLPADLREDVVRRHKGNSYVIKGTKIPWGTDNILEPKWQGEHVAAKLTTSRIGDEMIPIHFWGGEFQDYAPGGFVTEDIEKHDIDEGRKATERTAAHLVKVLQEIRKIKVPIEEPKAMREGPTYKS